MNWRRAAPIVAAGWFVTAGALAVGAETGDTCVPETVAIDTSLIQGTVGAFLGMSAGQSFTATDTLIRSITVWGDDDGPRTWMKLWVTLANESGSPLLGSVIQEGPAVISENGTGQPVKVQFAFDPPLVLPGPGKYGFFVQDPCFFYFDLYVSYENPYPGGRLERTSRTRLEGCRIDGGINLIGMEAYDLVFEIEFCNTDSTTPIRPTSWGQLKRIYR